MDPAVAKKKRIKETTPTEEKAVFRSGLRATLIPIIKSRIQTLSIRRKETGFLSLSLPLRNLPRKIPRIISPIVIIILVTLFS